MAQMNRVERQAPYEHPAPAGRHRPQAVASFEREPWRFLQPSLAIRFYSEREKGWSPDSANEHQKTEIVRTLEARWAARLAYAEMKSAIFDLVWSASRSGAHLSFAPHAATSDEQRRAILRKMTLTGGPLSSIRDEIVDIIQWLDESEVEIELFAMGFVEVRLKKSDQTIFSFEMGRRHEQLTAEEVRSKAQDFARLATDAVDVLRSATRRVAAH